ncbi:hypothetical protein ACSQ8I_12465 [Marinovum sp. E06]|uniref:hypothetical protein n=1 Tax=Marinovum sp. E06 TaxID=3449225 RepID=UPI003EDBA0B4
MPRRIPLTKSTLAFGSGVIIFSVGFVLQNFGTHPASSLQDAKRPDVQTAELPDTLVESADLSAITPTSAGVLPVDRPLPPCRASRSPFRPPKPSPAGASPLWPRFRTPPCRSRLTLRRWRSRPAARP